MKVSTLIAALSTMHPDSTVFIVKYDGNDNPYVEEASSCDKTRVNELSEIIGDESEGEGGDLVIAIE